MNAKRVESRWPPAVAVLLFLGLNVALRVYLPGDEVVTVPWLAPTVELILLCVLVASDPIGIDRRSRCLRRAAIALVLALVATSLWATVVLIGHLITGSPVTNSAGYLLASGALVLIGNGLAFSLLFWQFDSGGQLARFEHPPLSPDLAFPQQINPRLASSHWTPAFYDYLYLGFTNTTAFSPTDVMPLAHWAKLMMALQSTVSLVVLGLVIARAVNVLS
jgi:uncharacterized membrane protein